MRGAGPTDVEGGPVIEIRKTGAVTNRTYERPPVVSKTILPLKSFNAIIVFI